MGIGYAVGSISALLTRKVHPVITKVIDLAQIELEQQFNVHYQNQGGYAGVYPSLDFFEQQKYIQKAREIIIKKHHLARDFDETVVKITPYQNSSATLLVAIVVFALLPVIVREYNYRRGNQQYVEFINSSLPQWVADWIARGLISESDLRDCFGEALISFPRLVLLRSLIELPDRVLQYQIPSHLYLTRFRHSKNLTELKLKIRDNIQDVRIFEKNLTTGNPQNLTNKEKEIYNDLCGIGLALATHFFKTYQNTQRP